MTSARNAWLWLCSWFYRTRTIELVDYDVRELRIGAIAWIDGERHIILRVKPKNSTVVLRPHDGGSDDGRI